MKNRQESKESVGNRLYRAGKYEDALKAYRRAMKESHSEDTFVYMDSCINLIRNGLKEEQQWRKAELTKEHLDISHRAVIEYPEDARLWFNLAYAEIYHEKEAEFLKAFDKFVSLAQKIRKDHVESLLSTAFSLGHIEICLRAILKYEKPYRQIQDTDNPLAQILSVFGPVICTDHVLRSMLNDWYADGRCNLPDWGEGFDRQTCYAALFRREDVREWVLDLPIFDCLRLDKVAVIFKIIVHHFNGDLSAVKELFSQNLRQEDQGNFLYSLMTDMAAEIAFNENGKGNFDSDFLAWVPSLKPQAEIDAEIDEVLSKSTAEYIRFLLELIKGDYVVASSIESVKYFTKKPDSDNEKGRRSWDQAHACIAKGDATGAIKLLSAYIARECGISKVFLYHEKDILFALLYYQERFIEAREVMPALVGEHPLNEYITTALEFEEPEKEDPQTVIENAKEQALASFDRLRTYSKQHPHDLMATVKEYIRDPQRTREGDTVAVFLHYLILRGAQYLGDGDMDEGTENLFALLSKNRDAIRREIDKEYFDRIWLIVSTLKRIERILTPGCLSKGFRESLNSDADFAVDLAEELIQHDWHKNSKLSAPYRDFLLWFILQKLGIEHYSFLFSEVASEKGKKKKKKRKVLGAEHVEGVTKALLQEQPEEWQFFVSRNSGGAEQAIDPTPEAFNAYFVDSLIVDGIDILQKIRYLLQFDKYERIMSPRLKLDIYAGYRKMKLGPVRIFWIIDDEKKEIHFFALNRRDAY